MKHKGLAILLCLAMVLTMILPGTLAVSAVETADDSQTVECTCGMQDNNHATDCALYVAPEEEPSCTCGTEDGTHAEDCPLHDDDNTDHTDNDDETEETVENTEEDEEPEGTPPESWGSASLAGAVSFTSVAPLMQFGYGIATLELNDEYYGISTQADNNSGIVLNKTATANGNGSFKITLEAYATGEQTTVSHYDPADIVLVLDTSASMKYPMTVDDATLVYGNTGKQNQDGNGKTEYTTYTDKEGNKQTVSRTNKKVENAYAIEGHDATSYSSCFQTYFVQSNGEFVPVYYYGPSDGTVKGTNGQNSYGWFTYDSANKKYSGPLIPKTSATDNNGSHVQFYTFSEESTRMYALKESVNTFIDNVFSTPTDSSIAIVQFGTSVSTVSEFSNNGTALTTAVNNLTASGATNTGEAMARAATLITSLDSGHDTHKKVVIMFTDGAPTTSGTVAFDDSIANQAIAQSKTLKIQKGVTVYTVGIFSGADGALSSAANGTKENKFMHYVSSNYPEASSMTSSGDRNRELSGTDSYYLSASNAADLKNIFQKISEQVGGAANSTLGSSTVVKDIIAPSFTVPANTSDIEIYTANCTGAGLTFGNRTTATDVTATIEGDTLNVTGFDFSSNWCGSHSGTYSGKKLIIEFNVSPKEGFLGGNGVPTNGETSGVYVNGENIAYFDVPTVNVPIADITISAADKNVYLTQVPTEEQLKSDVTIKCGNVDITDPSKLEDWQKAYVNLEGSFTNSTGFDATTDGTYNVTAAVSPTTPGDSSKPGTVATAKNGTETKNINVFKPELTYKDSEVYYGDNAPTNFESNLTKTEWKHGVTKSTDSDIIMIGTAPTLDLAYTPETGKIVEGKIATKQDIAVDVTVKIGTTDVTNQATFQHTDCNGKTCGTPENGKFWLHVKTCSLTITKAAGANTTVGNDEYFVFTIKKDGEVYTQVTIQGTGSVTISELPVGTYTVEEDTTTAWCYENHTISDGVTLASTNDKGTITCTNSDKNDKWLNHFAQVINVYGKTN